MELVLLALPFLAFLACPLMMLFCLVGMRKMGCSMSRAGDAQTPPVTGPDQVATLQRQLQTIQADLAVLHPSETPAPHPAVVRLDAPRRGSQPEVTHAARHLV